MKIRSIKVADFKRLRSCEFELGSGLNVLFGPNDLGKSTLAEAVRAAFLAQVGSKYTASLQPWGSDAVPTVTVEFETGGETWRLIKSFGNGTRGKARLELMKNGQFGTETKGRSVDGKLRELLAWGLSPPGGRGRASSKPTFLITALLGAQGDADSIFSATLDEDPISSGRDLINRSLDVVSEDPLVRRLLETLSSRLDKVVTETGRKRSTASSPLVQSADRVHEAERELKALQQQKASSAATMIERREAVRVQDEEHGRYEDAKLHRAKLAERSKQFAERLEAEKALQRARTVLDRAREAQLAVVEAEAAKAQAAETERALTEACERAKEAKNKALRELADAEAEAAKIEKSAAVAESERDRQRLGLENQLDAANQALRTARQAVEAQERVDSRSAEIVKLEEHLSEAEHDVAVSALRLEAAKLGVQLEEIDLLKERVEQATQILEATQQKADTACAAESAAEEEVKAQEEALEELRDRLQTVTSTEQRRATDLQNAQRALVALELSERETRTQLEKRRELSDGERSLEEHEAKLLGGRSKLDTLRQELEDNDRQSAAARVVVDRADNLLMAMKVLSARERLAALQTRREQLAKVIEQLDEANAQVDSWSEKSRSRQDVSIDQLGSFRSLSITIEKHESSKPVSVPFPFVAATSIALFVAVVTFVATAVAHSVGTIAIVAAAAGAVGGLVITGGILRSRRLSKARALWRERKEELAGRWRADVEPMLRSAGVNAIDALSEYRAHSAKAAEELASAKATVRSLERERWKLEVPPDTLSRAEGELTEVESRFDCTDCEEILKYAAAIHDRKELLSEHSTAQRKLVELKTVRQSLVERELLLAQECRAAAESTARLKETNARQRAALSSESDESSLEAALSSILSRRGGIEEEIARLEGATADVIAQAHDLLESQQARRDVANADRATKAKAHAAAREELTKAKSNHERVLRDFELSGEDEVQERLLAVRSECQSLGEPLGNERTDIDELTLRLANDRKAHDTIRQNLNVRKGLLESEIQRAEGLASTLQVEPAETIQEKLGTVAELQAQLEALEASRESVPAATAQEDRLGAAEQCAREANEAFARINAEREKASGETSRLAGELEVRKTAAAECDIARAEEQVSGATSALKELAAVEEVTDADLKAARQHVEDAGARFRAAVGRLGELQGRLQLEGGAVLDERLREQEQIVERRRAQHQEIEDEYEAQSKLHDLLNELNADRASHLGRALAGPVGKKLQQLAGDRYEGFRLDSSLKAEGVVARGAVRDLSSLSVGTREQLASLVRLSIAEHLGTALILDDQLVHSDEDRLGWFVSELRRASERLQIIVFTCRPSDYLTADEMAPVRARPHWDAGGVVAIDLAVAINGSQRELKEDAAIASSRRSGRR